MNDPNAQPFQEDALLRGGYLYSTGAPLSSRMANERLTTATLAIAALRDQRVLDIGCGDGTYSVELFDRAHPAELHGIDPAEAAIKVARSKIGKRSIQFDMGSAYDLPYPADRFDAAHLRGVLHHLDDPVQALREALRVAATVVVIEPNGYSPVLKLLERVSRYHRQHGEKSYAPHRLKGWVEGLGAEVTRAVYAGLVPMFTYDGVARAIKVVEPLVESLPLVRNVACAVYVFSATRRPRPAARSAAA
jgi:ubiquinone/menaquinone biosynthesis C-methylase UbiE